MNASVYPENALILAPLSGFTDLPYRRSARRHGAIFTFAEMVDAASLAHTPERGLALTERGAEEEFLGVQVVGAEHEWLKRSCDELNAREFSLLDFNLGCPVAKVVKKGAGAALGRHIDAALKCFKLLTRYSRFPVTAKFRILAHDDPAPTVELALGLAQLGAKALTVHGRTLEDFYTGPVRADIIAAVREAVAPYGVPVIANGGVRDRATCEALRKDSGCSRIMVAQGAMGNPWLFDEIVNNAPPPTLEEWKEEVHTHVFEMVGLYGEKSALRQARKIIHDYLKGRGFAAVYRNRASLLCTFSEFEAWLVEARPAAESASRPFRVSG
jgi:tRNA-dihydrouridine synthase B